MTINTLTPVAGPNIKTTLPGPKARRILEGDERYISPSYTRSYPLVAKRGRGVIVEDVDGNEFFDFSAGIAGPRPATAIPRSSPPSRSRLPN